MKTILFLHIPKTAGQSIRHFLTHAFPYRPFFPGQTDHQLAVYNKSDLAEFKLFSGHFSPSLMDAIGSEKIVFSVLRGPVERIISHYRYMRSQAKLLGAEHRSSGQYAGLFAALDMPLDRFLSTNDPAFRNFVRSSLDNFYTYYFGTRRFDGRWLIRDIYPESDYFTTERILQNAIINIQGNIDVFYTDRLSELTVALSGEADFQSAELGFINTTDGSSTESIVDDFIKKHSEDERKAREYLHMFTEFDVRLFKYFRKPNHT